VQRTLHVALEMHAFAAVQGERWREWLRCARPSHNHIHSGRVGAATLRSADSAYAVTADGL
jgi:hypothetical protein